MTGTIQPKIRRCTNCRRPGGAFMSSSAWGHPYQCCGDGCGLRLRHRIKYGFKPGMRLDNPNEHKFPPHPSPTRVQIKMLQHGVKRSPRFDGYFPSWNDEFRHSWWGARRSGRYWAEP